MGWISQQGLWRNIGGGCTRQSQRSTGTVCQSVRQNTFPHVFDVIFLKGNSKCQCPLPGCLRYSRTWNGLQKQINCPHGCIYLGYWRNSPNPSPNASGAVSRSYIGALITVIMTCISASLGSSGRGGRRTSNTFLKPVGWSSVWNMIQWITQRPFCTWDTKFYTITATGQTCDIILGRLNGSGEWGQR